MAQTNEEKKKKILNYLEENAKTEAWFKLSKNEILDKFSDAEFDKSDIRGILGELRRDGRTDKYSIRFDIRFPIIYSKEIKNKLKNYVETPRFIIFLLGFYVLFGFVTAYPKFLLFLQNKLGAKNAMDFFLFGAIIGIFGSYSIGWTINWVYKYLEDKIPLIRKNQELIMPFMIVGIISIGIVGLFSLVTKKPIDIGHILAWLGLTIAGGFAYLNWNKKSNSSVSRRKGN